MKLRQGRRVGRHLYHQQGPEPADTDPPVGMVDTPELAATIVRAVNAIEVDVQIWPLARALSDIRYDHQDWSWEEEWADLDERHAETGYLDHLEQQIKANGITMPLLIGSDGRLWDGHHRLRIAVRVGIPYVPVEIVPSKPSTEEGK